MHHTAKCHTPPSHLLACPKCQADTHSGFEPEQQRCQNCSEHYFDLAGMPCWFDTGIRQHAVWQNLYANMLERGETNLAQSQALLNDKTQLASTQARLHRLCAGNQAMLAALNTLLAGAGLSAIKHAEYADHDASHMLQYYELLLRDWAWPATEALDADSETNHVIGRNTVDENRAELNRIAVALKATGKGLGDTWVIGAGAGRLSVDMHMQLGASHTIALDANLLLITAAHRLVTQNIAWQLPELNSRPQHGFATHHVWSLPYRPWPNYTTPREHLQNWYAMAGNAWQPPLKPGCFDSVVTPWFMDVNGREPAALIAQVQKYLKPGGLWLNTGPLLYSASLNDAQKLSHDEIIELLVLAGFEVVYQNIETSAYLNSPLNAQTRTEQIWTFAAVAPLANATHPVQTHLLPAHPLPTQPPAWVLLPHLPIPINITFNTQGNAVLEQLAAKVDGVNSLNSIAEVMRANLGPEKDALEIVRNAFVEYLLV